MYQLEVAKELFEVFVNRLQAYRLAGTHHLGLISFSSVPKISQNIGSVAPYFKSSVRTVSSNGITALWDALAMAHEEIARYAKEYPDAKKRVIVLSDGEDNNSKKRAQEVCLRLQVKNSITHLTKGIRDSG